MSSNAAATATALGELVQDVRGYYDASQGLLLLDVGGVGRDAVARSLTQQGVDASKVTVVPGGTKAGTLVVARRSGVEVAQFRSVTSIVPVVQLAPSPYDCAVKNVMISMQDAEWKIEKIQWSKLDPDTTKFVKEGAGGVWLSPREYV